MKLRGASLCLLATLVIWSPAFGDEPTTSFWKLTELNATPVDEDAILQFDDHAYGVELALDAPCVHRGWAFSNAAGVLRASNLFESQNRCATPLETAFDGAVGKIAAISKNGESLAALAADGHAMLRATRLRSTALENRRWAISSYRVAGRMTSSARVFGANTGEILLMHQSVFGSPGCGGLVGGYNFANETLHIDAGAILAGFCPGRTWEASEEVLHALNGDLSVRIDGDTATLSDRHRRVQVMLTALPEAP
ncbi:MAG: META domain-containing protein [Pseudomonadota bacterium]